MSGPAVGSVDDSVRPGVRLRWGRRGKVRFLSHRDMARVWERAIRRAKVPVAYSQGFSPRPKLHFGLALSTGYESRAEYLDVDLDPSRAGVVEPDAVAAALVAGLPDGIEVQAAAPLRRPEPSLQESVTSCEWVAEVDARDDLAACVGDLLGADTIPLDIVRKGKQVREDLRPLLVDLAVIGPVDGPPNSTHRAELHFELGTKPRSVRPAELLSALGIEEPRRVVRTRQWIQRDGERFEPLELVAPSPHAQEVRAS